MDYADITYEVADRIATVTLNRPEARNGYTVRMADELGDAMDRADADEDVRVVVLTGNGKDFCVGADLSSGGFDFDLATGQCRVAEDLSIGVFATRVVNGMVEVDVP